MSLEALIVEDIPLKVLDWREVALQPVMWFLVFFYSSIV